MKAVLFSILLLICAAGITLGVLFIKERNDPTTKIIVALEKGDYTGALSISGDADSDALHKKLETRLETIISGFKNGDIEYSVVTMELSTIEKMKISALSSKLETAKKDIDELNASRTAFSSAESLFKNADYVGAMAQYRLVSSKDVNYEKAKEGVNKAITEYRKVVIAEADKYANENDFESAMEVLNEALNVAENDSEINQKLVTYKQKYVAITLAEADALVKEEDFDKAISLLNKGLTISPEDAQITGKIDSIVKLQGAAYSKSIIAEADAYAEAEDYENAIKTLNNGLRASENDADMTKKLETYTQKYVDVAIAAADARVAKGEYDEAITDLNSDLQVVSGNAKLTEKIADVKASKPVDFANLVVIDSKKYEYFDTMLEDSFGERYNQSFNFEPYANWRGTIAESDPAYAVYNLGGNYKTFSAEIVAPKGTDSDATFLIDVYLDDATVPVKSIEGFDVRSGNQPIQVDVSNATKLTVIVRAASSDNGGKAIRFVNATLSK